MVSSVLGVVTDAVMEDAGDWQSRPLEKSCAIVCLDALRVNSRQDGKSCQKSVCAALGVNFEGKKEVGETPFRTACGQRKPRGEVLGAGAQRDPLL
jgi:transposase-like protein